MIYLNDDNTMKMILFTSFLGFSEPTYTEIFKYIHNYIKAHNIPDYDKSLFNNTTLNSTANNMIDQVYKNAIKKGLL